MTAPSSVGTVWFVRRQNSRIAAGIVAIVAAAGALVLAEREALGSSHVLPWVPPLPSAYQMPWSPWAYFGQEKRAEGATETGARAVGGMADSDALAGPYGWPLSP